MPKLIGLFVAAGLKLIINISMKNYFPSKTANPLLADKQLFAVIKFSRIIMFKALSKLDYHGKKFNCQMKTANYQ